MNSEHLRKENVFYKVENDPLCAYKVNNSILVSSKYKLVKEMFIQESNEW